MKTINLVVLIFLIFNTRGSYSQEIGSIEQQLDSYRKKNKGYSHISIKSKEMWGRCGNIVDKGKKWLNNAYGLIVHSTGRSIITRGLTKKDGIVLYNPNKIISRGKNIFNQNNAINYILGWGGIKNNHLIQIGNENKKCVRKRNCKCYSGVSMSEQKKHIKKYGFGKELKQSVYNMWRKRWKGYKTPLNLIPKGGIKNLFIQIECIPLPPKNKRNSLYKPLREGLWFTKEQHDAVALLACDIAIRNGWDLDTEWWKSNKLLGHEDLSPVTRSSSSSQVYIDDLKLFTKKENKYIINKKNGNLKYLKI